jgi:hypothetical protein
VRRHAKASSAGPSRAQASRLGHIFRGALATRSGSDGVKGSSAPSTKLILGFAAALFGTLVFGVTLAIAAAPVVTVEEADSVTSTAAHFAGTVDPGGEETSCRFDYITDAAFQPRDEQQEFVVQAQGGTFTLTFSTAGTPLTTDPIPFDAPASGAGSVQAALEALANIGPGGASVGGGPGDEEGTHPYKVTFSGPLGATNVEAIVPDGSGLTGEFAGVGFNTGKEGHAEGFEGAAQIPCDVDPLNGSGATAVGASVTGLEPHTTYHLSLHAENAGGTTAVEAAQTFTTLAVAPVVHHTSVVGVTSSQATLHAEINPGGDPTTYRFQYMTDAAYQSAGKTFTGAIQTPVTNLAGAADNVDHLAFANLSGLAPDTTYHYQALAANSIASAEGDGHIRVFHTLPLVGEEADSCPNASLRSEQHATFLPDCRAYEQVSPADKHGGQVVEQATRVQAAPDGSAIKFSSLEGYSDVRGFSASTDYISVRGAGGWSTHAITPEQEPGDAGDAVGFFEARYVGILSSDLSHGVFLAKSPIGVTPKNGRPNLYLRDDLLSPGAGSYQLLSESVETLPYSPSVATRPEFSGASADYSHVIFEDKVNLTQETLDAEGGAGLQSSQPKLYEWVDDGVNSSETRLVGQVPVSGNECIGAACVPASSQAGRGTLNQAHTESTISRDGSRVVFTASPFGTLSGHSAKEAGTLFLRDDKGTFSVADDTSTKINASELASPEEAQPAAFWAATKGVDAAGTRVPLLVFFTSSESLTEDDHNGTSDLYRWSEEPDDGGHHLTMISVDHEPSDIPSPVVGALGASSDGSSVYFVVGGGQLVANGSMKTDIARIYLWKEGNLKEVGGVNPTGEVEEMFEAIGRRVRAQATPDGSHLAFVTQGTEELLSLYGKPEYDHGGASCSLSNGTPGCIEVYVYDANANGGNGDLQCASCNPSGEKATAAADFWRVLPNIDSHELTEEGASKSIIHLTRAVSDDGHYVFFNSAEALLPQDTNGISDAYEYDTQTEEVHLLSSGTSPAPSYFYESTPDGSHAFIRTAEPLVGWDNDGSQDLYDVHVDGGFPEPAPVPAPCAGDQCRGGVSGSPNPPGTPTATFSGPGDPVAKRAHKKKRHHQKKRRHRRHSTRSHG